MFKKFNSNLSIGTRLGISSALFAVAGVVGLALNILADEESIQFAVKEKAGADYLQRLWTAWQSDNCCEGSGDDALNRQFRSVEEYSAFAASPEGSARDRAAADLFAAIADGSNLTLDPELSSFYLMEGIVTRIPAMMVQESELDEADAAPPGPRREANIIIHATQLNDATDAANNVFERALTQHPDLAHGLESTLGEVTRIGRQMAAEEVGGTIASQQTEADFPRILTTAWAQGHRRLVWVLDERIRVARIRQITETMLGLALLLSAAAMAWLTSSGLSRRFKALGTTMDELRAGNASGVVPFTSDKHETGKIASTLEAMRANMDAQQALQLEATYKSAAFDGSSVACMMVDRDFKVVYANIATMALLRKNADAFRKLWPSFNPEQIVGSCIDMFHKNPAHQRQLLSDPSRLPFRTDINVGDLKIALNVSGVFDASRNYVGNILQWDDVTESRVNAGILAALDRAQAMIEFNLDGTILGANDAFCRAIGYSVEEIRGRKHSMFIDPTYAQSAEYSAFWDKLRRGEFHSGKYQRFGRNNKEVWLDATYNPILDGNGRPFKVVKLANDVTALEMERRAVEQERVQAG